MRSLFGGKSTAKRSRKRASLRRRPARRFSPHALEHLEARSMMTAAPFVGPLLPVEPTADQIAAAAAATPGAETTIADSINAFALDLYRILQLRDGGSGNLFISPLSISAALAMAYAGAGGTTAEEIASALHFEGDARDVAQQFGALLADLNSADHANYEFASANALWAQQGIPLDSDFLDLVSGELGGALRNVDFVSNPEAARDTINQWVAEHTADRIQGLFPEGAITSQMRLVLANAIFFKGDWAAQFDPADTYDAPFRSVWPAVQVPTMHRFGSYRYMQRDGYQVVELPYRGDRLVMDVLMRSGQVDAVHELSVGALPGDWTTWFEAMDYRDVQLSLPKFKMTADFELSQIIEALGIRQATSDSADFSRLGTGAELKISNVVHKAFVSVDESGAEAAAATGIGFVALASAASPPPVVFNADHEFLFVIRDRQTGAVLFMGQVVDPLSGSLDPSADPVIHYPQVWISGEYYDVNDDGRVDALDALRTINYMIRESAGVDQSGDLSGSIPDVNRDGIVSPLDVLLINNEIIRRMEIRIEPPRLRVRLRPVPISLEITEIIERLRDYFPGPSATEM